MWVDSVSFLYMYRYICVCVSLFRKEEGAGMEGGEDDGRKKKKKKKRWEKKQNQSNKVTNNMKEKRTSNKTKHQPTQKEAAKSNAKLVCVCASALSLDFPFFLSLWDCGGFWRRFHTLVRSLPILLLR